MSETPDALKASETPDASNGAAPELLAPAGSPDALRAAVQNGADAVYLGYGRFHARVRAAGFSEDAFRDAVRYCHLYGVRVYLTLNTLLTDRELPAALDEARNASRLGVDAVLVQDWGLLALLRACLPDLPVHASTQMSVFTSGGVRLLREAGCTRIVAARECSRDDIAALCRNGGAEIETFVHGALCMCYSGQCEMSALIGARSGNRGRCAQPCRLPCGVGKFAPDVHALSLKDMNMSAHLDELREIGVACLKIEGRLKRPEYVALVTSVYARLLRERREPSPEESALLERVFSRSGFTDAYWRGERGPQMFGTRPDNVPDAEKLFQEARATYENDRTRKIGVTFDCAIHANAAARLTVSDADGHSVTVTGGVPEAARTRPLTPETVSKQLAKTGAAYRCDAIRADVDGGLSLPVSALNALRRDALDALSERRAAVPTRREFPMPPPPDNDSAASAPDNVSATSAHDNVSATSAPRYTVSVYRPAQLVSDLLTLSPARIYLPLEWFAADFTIPDWLRAADTELCAILPRVWRDRDESALSDTLRRAASQGLTGVLAGNIGHLPLIHDAAPDSRIYGDFGLNVTNAHSAAWLRAHGLQSVCVSFELRTEQIRDMPKPLPAEAILYGRLPLMITENYPGGVRPDTNVSGTRPDDKSGRRPRNATDSALIDRTGAAFPLLDAFGGRVELQNSRPLWLADRDAWRNIGLSFARLRFTTESPDECADVIRAYLERRAPDRPFTRGLYERGVE
ncbi:MAG: U32 family peptidase [Oscillibacter sp.]|nr:U32 family peptidase [Oscillibacter sp.]